MQLELAWGSVRRWWLKTFCQGYVARMASLRQGDFNPCPFEVLDPRDLKFYRNQGGIPGSRRMIHSPGAIACPSPGPG
jgi:phosphatidylserine decarboxylase